MIAIPIGWSMFSTYMIAEDMDLASVVSPIVDDVIIIKGLQWGCLFERVEL